MSVNFTALTIGPIYDTMLLTSSPAGLWGASALFSWLARELIQQLIDLGVPEDRFISPRFGLDSARQVTLAYSDETAICGEMQKIGVGLFHDRIIFDSAGLEAPLTLVQRAKENVIQELSDKLAAAGDRTWLEHYLRIYALNQEVSDEESPLLVLGNALGAMELEPHFTGAGQDNKLLGLFENTDGRTSQPEGRNEKMKDFFLVKKLERWMLYRHDKQIRDLQDIASVSSGSSTAYKYAQYYAVLKSDGDSMGEVLKQCLDKGSIRDYSQKCLIFCAKAAKLIRDYSGVPLYAGGDDLLALAPVVGFHPEHGAEYTIMGLIEQLRTLFNQCFHDYRQRFAGKPTISFGISIQYYKSPLYEALERADEMLRRAKDGLKNACFLHLQKHSGQSVLLTEEQMDRYGETGVNLLQRLDRLMERTDSKREDADQFLSGAGYQIERYRTLFYQAVLCPDRREQILNNLFDNLFDNADQKQFEGFLTGLKGLTNQLIREACEDAEKKRMADSSCDAEPDPEQVLARVQSMVRLLHFMREKGEEEA